MSIAVIANPLAGRGRGEKTARLAEDILRQKNVDFELIFTKNAKHAIELARQASCKHEIVAALGGDGTIREVLTGIQDSHAVLGIIPGGTGNDYARGLGIPRETAPAIDVLLEKSINRLDVGYNGSRLFGVLASIGFPVDVIQYVNNRRDSMLRGKLAFLSAVMATVRNLNAFPVKINVDGREMTEKVVGLFVMNMPYGGGGMKFTPDAHYNEGLFDILIIKEVTRMDLAMTLPKIYSGSHTTHPAVTILKGRDIIVEGPKQPIMLDGDIFPAEPLRTRLLPQKTAVIVPTSRS